MRARFRSHPLFPMLVCIGLLVFRLAAEAGRPCPMHGDPGPAGPAPAGHAGHSAQDAPTGSDQHSSHPCDCSTVCCAIPSSPDVASRTPLVAAHLAEIRVSPLVPAPPPLGWQARLLPFANGPPALLA